MSYTHLHFHTDYSLLDGANKIKNVAKKIKELGMSSVAITDHGNMFGAIDFYQTMSREGIKPIIGMEAYVTNHDFGVKEKGIFHLCLYAKDEVGYQNLMYLSSQAFENMYYKPRIPKKMLKERSEGLVCTSACLAGEVNFHLNQSDKNRERGSKGYEEAKKVALEYKEIFGDDFYLEIMRHGIGHQFNIDNDLIRLSKETGIQLVATNDTHYTNAEDSEAHEVYMAIGTGKTWNDPKRMRHTVHEFFIKSPADMEKVFKDIPEAVENTNVIADKCNLKLNLGNPTPPNFKFTLEYAKEIDLELPQKEERFSFENDAVLFTEQSRRGLEERLKFVPEEEHQKYRDRLEHEINTINSMKFPGYMLIVWDFVRYSGETNIPVGPGRGCLTKEAQVYVKDGFGFTQKSIDEVQVGDIVISHKNREKEVLETFKYEIEEELYKIETFYGDFVNPIVLTGDHKVYLGNGEWKEAKEITEKDCLFQPIPKYLEDTSDDIKFDLLNFYDDSDFELIKERIFYKNDIFIKPVVIFNYNEKSNSFEPVEEFDDVELFGRTERGVSRYIRKDLLAELIIYYIYNGYLNEKHKTVNLVLNRSSMSRYLGIYLLEMGYKVYRAFSKDKETFIIQDRILFSFFKKNNVQTLFNLLNSLTSEVKNNILYMLLGQSNNIENMCDTNSTEDLELFFREREIAEYTRMLLLSTYKPVSIEVLDNIYVLKSHFASNEEEYQTFDDHIKLKVRKITKIPKKKTEVFDFSVKDDHSYTTTNYTVHNSAAGSLVAFALRITDIDPLKYDLLFERFLNPERVSMPDIDMDFAQNKRKEIIRYVQEKYGRENVAQVTTFSSLLPKGVIRDVSRVFDIPLPIVNEFVKLIPEELKITLKKAKESEPRITDSLQNNPDLQKVWDISEKLEGLKRNTGIHAAGLVISNEALWNKTPLHLSKEGDFVTQYSLDYLEDVDLIKFDFLGLKTLDVIFGAIDLVKKHKNIDIVWHDIDMNDPKVYEMMSAGKTIGMFQIESGGMRDLNKRMKPSNFEDVIALIALYRPGPMEAGMLDDFVERKHGRQDIFYPFEGKEFPEQLKEILDPTYGMIVYQEQVMQIVQKIGGFSLGKSDIVRRAMGKKKIDLMKEYKSQFADGAEEQGLDREIAEELFDLIEKFAGYGFNKSHSAAYAMITFQTAYLKAHYPAEFMASLLSTESRNMDKIALYVEEAKTMGIEILSPDINKSQKGFSIVEKDGKEAVLFGLEGIKGVGGSAVETIVEAQKNGEFKDIPDFLNRVKPNKGTFESLIKAGGFDKTNYNRKTLLDEIEKIVQFASEVGKLQKSASEGLFGDDDNFTENTKELKLVPRTEYRLKEKLELEKEVLNFYVSAHPLDEYREDISKLKNISKTTEKDDFQNWQKVFLVGFVEFEEKISNAGNLYGKGKISDFTGELEFMMFGKEMQILKQLDLSKPIGIKASLKIEDENFKLENKEFFSLDDAIQKFSDSKFKEFQEQISEFKKVSKIIDNVNFKHEQEVVFVGFVDIGEEKISKAGNPYSIGKIEDTSGEVSLIFFASEIEILKEMDLSKPIGMRTLIKLEGSEVKFNYKKFFTLDEVVEKSKKLKKGKTQEDIEPKVIENDEPTTETVKRGKTYLNLNFFLNKSEMILLRETAKELNGNFQLIIYFWYENRHFLVETDFYVLSDFGDTFLSRIGES
ncbi:DNA polymerase III, alpha subunit [Thiovulum sp. ES]|nr:DNA polymerase III, alpha subunit [Thiovulum sp. ES]